MANAGAHSCSLIFSLTETKKLHPRRTTRKKRPDFSDIFLDNDRSRGTYGAPRIRAELAATGTHVAQKRVARLMRTLGVSGVSRRRGVRTTRRQAGARPAPDLVRRCFAAEAPDRLWVADITYVPTTIGRFL